MIVTIKMLMLRSFFYFPINEINTPLKKSLSIGNFSHEVMGIGNTGRIRVHYTTFCLM